MISVYKIFRFGNTDLSILELRHKFHGVVPINLSGMKAESKLENAMWISCKATSGSSY